MNCRNRAETYINLSSKLPSVGVGFKFLQVVMSLGLLVGRFGSFVRETHVAPVETASPTPFPDELNHLREAVGHHLIPLVLIARSDGEFESRERDVIVTHCVGLARRQGLELDGSGTIEFVEYVETFGPA